MTAPELYRVVWDRPSGVRAIGEPLPRDEALAQFDNLPEIKRDACAGFGRLRVMAAREVTRLQLDGGGVWS